jgi:hypothetical protein
MHTNSVMKKLLRLDKIVIENMYFESVNDDEIFIVKVRPVMRELNRCPRRGTRCPGYTDSKKVRRWRSLDFGSQCVYIESNRMTLKQQ